MRRGVTHSDCCASWRSSELLMRIDTTSAQKKRSAAREVSMDAPAGGSDGFGFVDLLVASITSPSQAFSHDQKEFRLQQAIAELNDEQKEILRLRFVEGLPTKDIADQMGKSDGAIRVMLTRTVAQLQEVLTVAG